VGFHDLAICFFKLVGRVGYDLLEAQVVAALESGGMEFASEKTVGAINGVFSHQPPVTNIACKHVVNRGEQVPRRQCPLAVSLDLRVSQMSRTHEFSIALCGPWL
jgi:hypothetical protein